MKPTILAAFGLFLVAQASETSRETGRACFNHRDDDGDGKADCKDPDCLKRYKTYCQRYMDRGGKESGRQCFDHRDNDGDGKRDCQDPDCAKSKDRRVRYHCARQNQGNGRTDNPHTETRRECFDHKDNDGDGKTDCQDPDCLKDRRTASYCKRRNNGDGYGGGRGKKPTVTCSLGGIMGVALYCGNANVNDKAFCRSTCYRRLDPFIKQCGNSAAFASAKALLGVAAQMTAKCDKSKKDNPNTETGRECFDGKDNDGDGKSDCSDKDCMRDPRVRQRCQMYGGGGKDTGGGDGVCNLLGPAIKSCRGLDMKNTPKKQQCKTQCLQEAFDCIDNKMMKGQRAKIEEMKDYCEGKEIECDSILSNMGKVFQPLCCPSNARECARGPPRTCNAKCAELFVPFFDKCAYAIEMANLDNDGKMAHFADVCEKANKH